MTVRWKQYLPEIAIILVALFFTYRELGSFPRSWVDEGLFIMIAKNIASGHGYAIPLLNHLWYYPYFVAIGPTIILPSALSMKIFGLSVAAARLPMTFYILGSGILTYVYAKHLGGKTAARWSAALLVTLSAFINTGKPVLGEVPAFFFLLLGVITMTQIKKPVLRGVLSGVCFGLAIMTKLPNALILPALGVACLFAVWKRQWREAASLSVSAVMAVVIYAPWRWLEIVHTPSGSLTAEIGNFVFGGGALPVLNVLRNNPELLLRLPFLAFFVILGSGLVGLWFVQSKATMSVKIAVTVMVVLYFLYFANSYGWYRHLLTAHLLLIPFVPLGMNRVLRKNVALIVLTVIVAAQALWQFTHQGSGRDLGLAQAVNAISDEYGETDLLIQESEVFAQLQENPHWLYLPHPAISPTLPDIYKTPEPSQNCFARVRKLNEEDTEELGKRVIPIGAYAVVQAKPDCK